MKWANDTPRTKFDDDTAELLSDIARSLFHVYAQHYKFTATVLLTLCLNSFIRILLFVFFPTAIMSEETTLTKSQRKFSELVIYAKTILAQTKFPYALP